MPDQSAHARTFYDRISGVYDALADAGERHYRERGLELLAARPGERILDVGFGTGHALVDLARAVGTEGRVHGIDVSQGMADVAQKRLDEAGLADRVDLRVEAAPPLPFDDRSLDAVFLSFTLELFDEDVRTALLGEIQRTLAPDGRLGVVAMARVPQGEHESALERTYRWLHRHFPHIVDCQPIDVVEVLGTAGFSIDARERQEMFTLPVEIVVARPTHAAL